MGAACPVIVLCAPRSYSSVTAAMLGQHPGLYAFPELNLFLTDTLGELLDWDMRPATARQYLGGLTRAIAELEFGGQAVLSIERARDWLEARRDWRTGTVLHFLIARTAPRSMVDKSPRTSMTKAACMRAASMLPRGRFLHLTRHPATSIRSLSSTVADKGSHVNRAFAQMWVRCQQSILELTETLGCPQTMRVHGEEILRSPDEALAAVIDWLGLPRSADCIELMKHPECSRFAFSIPALCDNENDAEFLANPHLRQPGSELDCQIVSDLGLGMSLTKEVVELARQLGYAGCD